MRSPGTARTERQLRALHLVRLGLGAWVVASAVLVGGTFDGAGAVACAVVGVHLAALSLVEAAHRLSRSDRGRVAVSAHVVDVTAITTYVLLVGGPGGHLGALPHVHVAIVAVLLGARATVAVAALHVAALYAAATLQAGSAQPTTTVESIGVIAAGVVVTAAAMIAVSWLTRRTDRVQVDRLDALATFARACSTASTPDEIVAHLRGAVSAVGAQRVEVELADDGPGSAPELHAVLPEGHHPTLAGTANAIVVPLASSNQRVGTGVFVWPRATITEEELGAIERLCDHAAIAIGNLALRAEIERLAATDALTGLTNRAGFDAALSTEGARASRHGRPLSLLVIDIDHFKSVNDTRGHAVGDLVLAGVAGLVSGECRESDVAARFGGEEFCVLLPETDLAGAAEAGERIRATIEAAALTVPVTVSIGIAQFHADADAMFAAADEALYEAKRTGRNKVCTNRSRPLLATA